MPLGAVDAVDRGALFRVARVPVLTGGVAGPGTDFCRVAPFWHRHLWHNINGLWRWRQNGASPPLQIYGVISERYEPKCLTGVRVRCTPFRDFPHGLDTGLRDGHQRADCLPGGVAAPRGSGSRPIMYCGPGTPLPCGPGTPLP
jgi:hypothetical protein